MAKLLRREIAGLQEQVKNLSDELREWEEIGDKIFSIYHWKTIRKILKETKFFSLMANLKTEQARENMAIFLDEQLFGVHK